MALSVPDLTTSVMHVGSKLSNCAIIDAEYEKKNESKKAGKKF